MRRHGSGPTGHSALSRLPVVVPAQQSLRLEHPRSHRPLPDVPGASPLSLGLGGCRFGNVYFLFCGSSTRPTWIFHAATAKIDRIGFSLQFTTLDVPAGGGNCTERTDTIEIRDKSSSNGLLHSSLMNRSTRWQKNDYTLKTQ